MLKAKIGKEVVVRLPNTVGMLAQITQIVSDKGINILAASSWVEGNAAVIRLVTDDHQRVVDALREKEFSLKENDVVLTEAAHKPGMLRRLTARLAENGLDLRYLYATATGAQDQCQIVFSCTDNNRALVLLNK
jgi:hypothetical protein